jgi:hypothetical protein
LGKKTEVEILRAGIEIAREKKLLSPAALAKLESLLCRRSPGRSAWLTQT